LPEGDIHPDLASRLAEEASRSAQSILQMCIRALDYCPPVGITFGDYLRAIVTADLNFNPRTNSRGSPWWRASASGESTRAAFAACQSRR
jgi:hypothetical protein